MTRPKSPYPVGAVANFMIGRAKKGRRPLTHIKLQNLVYFAYGVYWADEGRRLFKQRIEPWPEGPVVPELYHEFKRFGARPIRHWSSDFKYNTQKFMVPVVEDDDRTALHALNLTWSFYGHRPTRDLTKFTRRPDGPWDKATSQGRVEIPDEWIKQQFDVVIEQVVARQLDPWGETG